MTNEITDKTHVIVLRGSQRLYINEQDYNSLLKVINAGGELLEMNGSLISKNAILYIMPARDFESREFEQIAIRRGDWKCKEGNWHKKEFNDCSCPP